MAAYDLNFDDQTQAILVDFRDRMPIAMAMAADSCRLSCASFQTMSLAADEMVARDSMPWSLIKLYYSAFYAGNALIRLFGESCSYFGRQHVSQVHKLAMVLNRQPNFKVDGGLYRCVVERSGTSFACTRARSGIGGAHEAFWDIFGKKMQLMAEQILQGLLVPTDAQAAFSQLEQFRRMLQRRANHSWLSVVRNDLQYRHEYNVWFPTQIRARERQLLSRQAAKWSNDPMSIELGGRGEMFGEFVACCSFVVSLCHAILTRISERSSVGKQSFVRLGPIAFLNDRAA